MEGTIPRFQCMPESGGTWMVWDNETGEPASLGGCVIGGRTEFCAKAAASILRRIYLNRLDAQSMRSSRTARREDGGRS